MIVEQTREELLIVDRNNVTSLTSLFISFLTSTQMRRTTNKGFSIETLLS